VTRDVEAVLAGLSTAERARLTAGRDLWHVPGVPGVVPEVRVTDGPNGARGSALLGAGSSTALCVPCGSALGATWDPALVEEVGVVLGEEARTKGARVLLAPTVNLVRHPLAGRSFECYSEDPLLSGLTAAGFVRGVQSRGVAATVKHLVGNEAEHERTSMSSEISERALRELYLVPFEHAVRAGVMAVMTAYNRVNGAWCSEDRWLLRDVLREEWGFDGVVMTDWFGVGSTVGCAEAGVDLQMPGPDRFYGAVLEAAVASGEVDPALLEQMTRRWLQLVDRLGAWDDEPVDEASVERADHRALARRTATEATVLLRNDGLLPLVAPGRVALVGSGAARPHVMGGGSAQLRPHRVTPLLDVLRDRLGDDAVVFARGPDTDKTVRPLVARTEVEVRDAEGAVRSTTVQDDLRCLWFGAPVPGVDESAFTVRAVALLRAEESGPHELTLVQSGRATVSVDGVVVLDGVTDPPPSGEALFGLGSVELSATVDLVAGQQVEVVLDYSAEASFLLHGAVVGLRHPRLRDPLEEAAEAAAAADVAVVVVGTSEEWESEGHDRASMDLPGEQDELVRRVVAANPRTVVVVCAGAPVTMPWADDVAAVLLPWLAGQEAAEAIADVLLGDAEPGGRLPVTLPVRVEHAPAHGSFPGDNDVHRYGEDLLVGYRWYDTRHLPVTGCFGAGLSYTTFAWSGAAVSSSTWSPGQRLVVSVDVTNTGDRAGSDVVQVYVAPRAPRLSRPRRELRGFAKAHLQPGETRRVEVALDDRAFAHWDPGSPDGAAVRERLRESTLVPAESGPVPRDEPGWWVDAGAVEVLVARSVEHVEAVLEVELAGGRVGP
jgi:beta-glucosidase